MKENEITLNHDILFIVIDDNDDGVIFGVIIFAKQMDLDDFDEVVNFCISNKNSIA